MEDKRPHLTADGRWRYDVEPNALRRKRDWDYRRPGSYEITLTLADRSRGWLGELVEIASEQARSHGQEQVRSHGQEQARSHGQEQARSHGQEQARSHGQRRWAIGLTPLGKAVAQIWRELGEVWPGVEPREAQVMPEHFHGILRVTTVQKHPLGQIVGSFKAKTTAAARAIAQTSGAGLAAADRAAAGTSELARAQVPPCVLAGGSLWSTGLHDRILWNLKRYRNARDYLLANPGRLAVKRANPDLFRVVRDLIVELPGYGASEQQGGFRGHFSAIGNHFLLTRSLHQIQVSRRDFAYRRDVRNGRREIARDEQGEPIVECATSAFVRRRDEALLTARDGVVLLSPCVSDGERQIARESLAAGCALIALRNKGFSSHQKPSGRAFDACSEGRLLLLAPAAWPYQPGEKPMTRCDATAMNRLCQWIAGEDAAAINYHGMNPANVDELAGAAAKVDTQK